MITFTEGNLLKANTEALVNTVNTVGVMGKGIALMFKEAFPDNFRAYAAACKKNEIKVGRVFVTERQDWVDGPKWIINFPTKQHWRNPSKIEWIKEGLQDLVRVIREHKIKSIALPPLGSGNGGLDWKNVRPLIQSSLGNIEGIEVIVYEPTERYQNVGKPSGVEKLTSARALVAELVRRYSVLGFECTLLEIQKLAYLLQRKIMSSGQASPLKLTFQADKFGPYAPTLGHLLNSLDGSYLHCEKRVADASVLDTIWFESAKKDVVATYLKTTDAKEFSGALDETTSLIDGFEFPLGMELLATVDWLLDHDKVEPTLDGVKKGLASWLGGGEASQRKLKLFDDGMIELALSRLKAN
ncbi:type II toxin-antitoxin system antitoxin DNA ADP-ribosyl glycohydrolase DarG [Bradyrhizobium sp. USDA 10063]